MMTNFKRFYILFFSFSLLTVFSVSVFYSDFFSDKNPNREIASIKNKQIFATSEIASTIQQAQKSVWKIKVNLGKGTGFFISPTLFVTNLHVVLNNLNTEDFVFKKMRLSQKGNSSNIKIKNLINLSFTHDLAIFETDQEVSHYLKLPSETPQLTDSIFLIGYPQGSFRILKNINSNFLENEHVINGYFDFNHLMGASGSPVLNEKGELIGVNRAAAANFLTVIKVNHLKKLIKSSRHAIYLSKNQSVDIQSLIKEKISKPNDMVTQYIMGMVLNYNKKLSKKYMQDSLHLIKKSAEEGYAPAQHELGKRFFLNLGIKRDFNKAFYWLELAAKQGDSPSQAVIGMMFYEGHGVFQNYEKAFYWLELAAKQGHDLAKNQLNSIKKENHQNQLNPIKKENHQKINAFKHNFPFLSP